MSCILTHQTPLANPARAGLPIREYCNATQIAEWLQLLIHPGQVTELLALKVQRAGLDLPITAAGFYDYEHLDEMAEEAASLSGSAQGIYFTFNPVNPDLLARRLNRAGTAHKGDLANDGHVIARKYLLIDVDPCRIGGVSSKDEEKLFAEQRILLVRDHLSGRGWPVPIMADSGNGFHLLYRVDLPTDDTVIDKVLKALAAKFDDERVKIDTNVHSPSRVTKVYGTLACKGDHTQSRPHRYSRLLEIPNETRRVDPLQLVHIVMEGESGESSKDKVTVISDVDSKVLQRARAYLAAAPPAISGDRGHDRTYEMACRLILGYNLSQDQALPLILEWNDSCQPPWTEAELRHKLEDADRQHEPKGRGYMLLAKNNEPALPASASLTFSALDGDVFHGWIPDFIPADSRSLSAYLF